jgi:hypothetical protein
MGRKHVSNLYRTGLMKGNSVEWIKGEISIVELLISSFS